eukprot:TRINITY_DN49158_c0_g1_i1.p1 TRINITY_DN49158_c0_g1~~TRINITY_DN49158_c0_g1_i1.p1  ORF type:complete len:135 (+),score=44.88 TRINITY_DN49158_c0_g1_i1:63-407(+)
MAAAVAEMDKTDDEQLTPQEVVRGAAQAGLLLVVVRVISQYVMTAALGSEEEGEESGGASSLLVFFVMMFHRLPGTARIGVAMWLLQLLVVLVVFVGASLSVGLKVDIGEMMAP